MSSQRCITCEGLGYQPNDYDRYCAGYTCPRCGGTGWIVDPAYYEPDPLYPIPEVENGN